MGGMARCQPAPTRRLLPSPPSFLPRGDREGTGQRRGRGPGRPAPPRPASPRRRPASNKDGGAAAGACPPRRWRRGHVTARPAPPAAWRRREAGEPRRLRPGGRAGGRDAAAAAAGGLSGRAGEGMRAAPRSHVAGERPRAGRQRQGEALLQQAALPRAGGGRWRGLGRVPRRRRPGSVPVRAVARRVHEPRAEDPLHPLALQQRARAPRPARPAPAPAAGGRRPGQLLPAGPAAQPRAPAAAHRRPRGRARRGGAAQPRQHLLHERHPAVPQQHRALRRVPGAGAVPRRADPRRPRPRRHRRPAARARRGYRAAGTAGAGALDAGVHPAAQPRLQGERGGRARRGPGYWWGWPPQLFEAGRPSARQPC